MTSILRTDRDWESIDGEPCRVVDFTPLGRVEHLRIDTKAYVRTGEIVPAGKVVAVPGMPYGFVTFECPRLSTESEGAVTHKLDFMHLWIAFKDRRIKDDEEVIIFWTKKPLRGFSRILAAFMPKLEVMVFKKGSYEKMTDPRHPHYDLPIEDWRPRVWG